MSKTLLETLQGGAKYLEARGVADARLNMEHLLAKVLRCKRLDLYLEFDRPMAEAELVPLRELLRQRGERVPLQHLLGEVEFHGRSFACDARALIPRPETEELVGILLTRFAEQPPQRVADVGCGSGVIGLSLAAEWPECEVSLTDRSEDALALTRENAARLGLDTERLRFAASDLLDACDGGYGLIVANLPYIPSGDIEALQAEVRYDPAEALDGGPAGTDLMNRLLLQAIDQLDPGGLIALEFGEGQGDALLEAAAAAGLHEAKCLKDLSGTTRFLLALR